jgi:hypothetical protein
MYKLGIIEWSIINCLYLTKLMSKKYSFHNDYKKYLIIKLDN